MLALDPFYEMFPTTRRPSYPWWRYSWNGLGQIIQTAVTPTDDNLAANRAAIEAQCPTKVALCANPSALREDIETLACCFFNAFKTNDVQAGRAALGVLDAAKQKQLFDALLARFPETVNFIQRVQTTDTPTIGTPGLSTCAKITIGAIVLGAVGVATIAFARRR